MALTDKQKEDLNEKWQEYADIFQAIVEKFKNDNNLTDEQYEEWANAWNNRE